MFFVYVSSLIIIVLSYNSLKQKRFTAPSIIFVFTLMSLSTANRTSWFYAVFHHRMDGVTLVVCWRFIVSTSVRRNEHNTITTSNTPVYVYHTLRLTSVFWFFFKNRVKYKKLTRLFTMRSDLINCLRRFCRSHPDRCFSDVSLSGCISLGTASRGR